MIVWFFRMLIQRLNGDADKCPKGKSLSHCLMDKLHNTDINISVVCCDDLFFSTNCCQSSEKISFFSLTWCFCHIRDCFLVKNVVMTCENKSNVIITAVVIIAGRII